MSNRLFIWATFIVILSAAGITGSRTGVLGPAEGAVLQVLAPVQRALHGVAQPAADFLSNVTTYDEIRTENQRLHTENERLRSELARMKEDQHEAEELKALLDVKESLPDEQFETARVIGRDPNRTRRIIAIDRGSDDGIREGMVVVGKGRSLVGTVTKVHGDYSFVRLITDPESSVTAMIQGTRTAGVANGSVDGRLTLDWVPQEDTVNVNATVVTSNLGGQYPDALLIGRVATAESDPSRPFQTIAIEPALDFSSLEVALVLTSFLPRTLSEG